MKRPSFLNVIRKKEIAYHSTERRNRHENKNPYTKYLSKYSYGRTKKTGYTENGKTDQHSIEKNELIESNNKKEGAIDTKSWNILPLIH